MRCYTAKKEKSGNSLHGANNDAHAMYGFVTQHGQHSTVHTLITFGSSSVTSNAEHGCAVVARGDAIVHSEWAREVERVREGRAGERVC
jgi:hypothetical protein